MNDIPGVTVTQRTEAVETKPATQSKTVWAIIATAIVTVLSNFFPQIKELLTPEVVNSVITVLVALAGIFLRQSVEDTKKAAGGAQVVKK